MYCMLFAAPKTERVHMPLSRKRVHHLVLVNFSVHCSIYEWSQRETRNILGLRKQLRAPTSPLPLRPLHRMGR